MVYNSFLRIIYLIKKKKFEQCTGFLTGYIHVKLRMYAEY